jgi:hypothetical protein
MADELLKKFDVYARQERSLVIRIEALTSENAEEYVQSQLDNGELDGYFKEGKVIIETLPVQ